MEFTIARRKDVATSSRIGTLYASANKLLDRLGMPQGEHTSPIDRKVRYEWGFKSDDGRTVLTIHDYKDDRPFRRIKEWHVGGKGDRAKIQKFFELYLPNGKFVSDKA